MARYRAQDITITAGTAVGLITNGTLNTSVALVETTGGGDTGRNRKAGYEDWTLDGTARYQGDNLEVGDEVTATMAINASGGSVSVYTGTGIINTFTVGGSHEDAVDLTFQISRSRD
jgi:hypothetical protein